MKNIRKLNHIGIDKYKMLGNIAILFLIIDVLIGVGIPYISSSIIDDYLPSGDFEGVFKMSALMVVLSILGILSLLVSSYFQQKAGQYAAADLRLGLFEKIQTLSFINIDKFKTGRLITSVTNDISQVRNFYGMKYGMACRAPLYILGGLIFSIFTSPKLSLIYIFIIPALALSIGFTLRKAIPFFGKIQKANDDINTVAIDNVNGPRVFKTFISEEYELNKFKEVSENYKNQAIGAQTRMAFLMPVSTMILNIGITLLIVLGSIFISNKSIPANAGMFLAFLTYSMKVLTGVMMFGMVFMTMSRASVSAGRIQEILDEKIDLVNDENGLKGFKLKGNIEFKDVSFKYGEGSNEVFSNINLKINAGEKIGIIGSTGSGKSSLIKLIPRLYDVSNGELLIDGKNIKDYDLPTLRNQISMATQEAIIFKGDIKHNILQGNKEATQEMVEKASELACAKEFIESKEGNFESEVVEKGSNLSGGQKQRLSLSRALIRKPSILILDDVTSALDSNSEEVVRGNLKTLKDMTLLIVSQKISSIIESDKIIVLDNYGNIDGFDSHENLLETSKVYKELYTSQFGGRVNA